jgi:penicillin amidase
MRIARLLRADSAVTPDAMRRYQTDAGNEKAELFVARLLAAAERGSPRVPDSVVARARAAAQLLAGWDRRYTKENERAVLFEMALDEVVERTWDELESPPAEGEVGRRVATPPTSMLLVLTEYPASPWWDDGRTADVVEDGDAILVAGLAAALDRAIREHGEPDAGGWRWDGVQRANVLHLLGLRSLSALGIPVQGGPGNLNPSSGSGRHGASWRMVVELGPDVRAWTIYPGGQSGNPVSDRYADRIDAWSAGELEPALFPGTPDELPAERVVGALDLRPGTR